MASLRSEAEQSAEFSVEAAAVALACQEIIPTLQMKLESVSRETGIISAKNVMFSTKGERTLLVKISRQDAKTKVTAQATAWEGLLGGGSGAQKLLMEFFSSLSKHSVLTGKNTDGW